MDTRFFSSEFTRKLRTGLIVILILWTVAATLYICKHSSYAPPHLPSTDTTEHYRDPDGDHHGVAQVAPLGANGKIKADSLLIKAKKIAGSKKNLLGTAQIDVKYSGKPIAIIPSGEAGKVLIYHPDGKGRWMPMDSLRFTRDTLTDTVFVHCPDIHDSLHLTLYKYRREIYLDASSEQGTVGTIKAIRVYKEPRLVAGPSLTVSYLGGRITPVVGISLVYPIRLSAFRKKPAFLR
jgi:hypothetical protein